MYKFVIHVLNFFLKIISQKIQLKDRRQMLPKNSKKLLNIENSLLLKKYFEILQKMLQVS